MVLEQVLVENEPVPLSAKIRVPPGRGKIQFQYTALSLTAPEKVRFRVRLAGFDRDWVEMAGNRSARYTQVPPGRYDFRVRACNNDGVWNEAGAGVALDVAPFWWQTVWFRVGVVVLAAATGAGVIRMRQARRREIERLRVRLAADLHVGPKEILSQAILTPACGTGFMSITDARRVLTTVAELSGRGQEWLASL